MTVSANPEIGTVSQRVSGPGFQGEPCVLGQLFLPTQGRLSGSRRLLQPPPATIYLPFPAR